MPPVSHGALKLLKLLDRPEVDNEEVMQALEYDPVLTANLLRACNSSYFSLEEPVSSVLQAILILGHRQIMQIVLSLAFGRTMRSLSPANARQAEALWVHSVRVALGAEALAGQGVPLKTQAVIAFTAGLLHDIGKLVQDQALSRETQDELAAALEHRASDRTIPDVERGILGTDHAEIGSDLLRQWRLPDQIVEAVANHHRPVCQPEPELSALVHTADALAHSADKGVINWEEFADRTDAQVLELVMVPAAESQDLLTAFHHANQRAEYLVSLR